MRFPKGARGLLALLLALLVFIPALEGRSYADGAAAETADSLQQARGGGLAIVRDGQANAVVIVAEDADAQTRKAADTLVQYVEKSTGARLPIATEQEASANRPGHQVRLFIGAAESKERPFLSKQLENMDGDGFLIRPHAQDITIIGPTPWGTEYGVYEFLERYVGVRWLMPGPDGEDVPKLRDITVPRREVKEEPVAFSRLFSPFQNLNSPDVQLVWARKNRIHGRVEMGHNLWALFPPEKYGESNPEFYPTKGGVRYIPAPNVKTGWQPCFSEEGTIAVAVQYILDYFRSHPEATSFSLGMNDGGGSCEADPSHPLYPNKKNSVGTQDLSDIYFRWVNRVAEEVLKVYPDKWFGLLAYAESADPPSFPVNDRVIPFIAKDRLIWTDDAIRENDRRLIRNWGKMSPNVALYDYYYGTPYLVPRVYPHLIADNMRFAADNGVTAHYIELYPNWGEGPKPWIAAKLMWDPYQNVDKLLQEWYERAVGREAAPYLKAYYDLWEKFWLERGTKNEWFDTYKSKTFLVFAYADYMKQVTEADVTKSRQLLETVVAKAGTDSQKARAHMLYRAFEYYEASAYSYPRKSEPPSNGSEAKALIRQGVNELVYGNKKSALLDEFAKHPVLKHWLNAKSYFNLNFSGWNPYHFWNVVDYAKENEPQGGPVRDELAAIASGGDSPLSRTYAQMTLKALAGELTGASNPSFEDGDEAAPPWTFAVRNTGSFKRVEGTAHTGEASVLAQGVDWGQVSQTIDVQKGLLHAQIYYYTPAGLKTNGAIRLYAYLLDAEGKQIGSLTPEVKTVAQTAGTWSDIQMIRDIPADIKGVPVAKVKYDVNVEALAATDELYLDDAELYYIPAD
ncbi:DUF4838 domain-containing protein [Paenibacillus flagellatus]|uniref:DUF4838 domain-containing protein n=1 Tax=Paenibacillus flagellatus TaxID=2211139 RepID=A0A2V5KE19_9BACL|nr:DUF4838 domain-containing protein [Paenibacillus flagellatus]PYI56544.1 hypothetical protein DLM86_06125 [Paenibacillus flagellatus]